VYAAKRQAVDLNHHFKNEGGIMTDLYQQASLQGGDER
jgi:hypothetical protein